jgi:hypothetical protein
MSVTALQLQLAQSAYTHAAAELEGLREDRNHLVQQAHSEGMAQVEIAKHTGLGKVRIGQIIQIAPTAGRS